MKYNILTYLYTGRNERRAITNNANHYSTTKCKGSLPPYPESRESFIAVFDFVLAVGAVVAASFGVFIDAVKSI